MKYVHIFFGLAFVLSLTFFLSRGVYAQSPSPTSKPVIALDATASALASESAKIATKSGIVERVVEKKPDITEPEGEVQGKLEKYLENNPLEDPGIGNLLSYAIRNAVRLGVPANTIVLILLFPVVAAIIAASRHLIGLRGFGIFIPAVLSVAFVATGIVTGIILFAVIITTATLARRVVKPLRLQYLPRMSLLLWFVSIGVLAALLISPYLNWEALIAVSIFPILILMLLAENFIEVQIGKSRHEAMELLVETIILALISGLILSLDIVQKFTILNPELLLISVALFNIFIGKYIGLRFTEYRKFKRYSYRRVNNTG